MAAGPVVAMTDGPDDTKLTDREVEVIALVAEGLTNEQIGERLGIVLDTVRSHLVRVSTRIGGLKSRAAIVNWAWQNGYLHRGVNYDDPNAADLLAIQQEANEQLRADNETLRNQVANLTAMYRVAVTHPGDAHRRIVVSALDKAEAELRSVREQLNGVGEEWVARIVAEYRG